MPRGTIDWKSPESFTRLLAALLASQDLKPNYKRIADYYGEGATYDSIEGRFRIIRRDAEKLKNEIDNGVRAPAPNRGTNKGSSPRKPRTPKGDSFEDIDRVMNGRVSKSANNTPTKRRFTAQQKKDLMDASAYSSNSSGDTSLNTNFVDDLNSFDSTLYGRFPQGMDFQSNVENMPQTAGDEPVWFMDDEQEQVA